MYVCTYVRMSNAIKLHTHLLVAISGGAVYIARLAMYVRKSLWREFIHVMWKLLITQDDLRLHS